MTKSTQDESLRLSASDLTVLATIAAEPVHGYDLWRRLEAADVADWAPVSKAQIYYSLKKLRRWHLIREQPLRGKCPSEGPPKAVFRVTKSGLVSLSGALNQPSWMESRPPTPFLTWAALSPALTSGDQRAQIEKRRAFLTAQIAREKSKLKSLSLEDDRYSRLACSLIRLVVAQFETERKWLDQFENDHA